METIDINFSTKNIPLCNLWTYKRSLLNEIERFRENLRWRVFYFKRPDKKKKIQTYGLKTKFNAPQDPDLMEFERRLMDIIKEVKFKEVKWTDTEVKMKRILKIIKQRNMIVTSSDKTNNFYLVKPEEYYRLMDRELNKEYKKDEGGTIENSINMNTKTIGEKLGIVDKLEILRKEEAYILLKDHKQSFHRERQARLINPIKNQLGAVTKTILDRINADCRKELRVNQLRSSQEAIDWFTSIQDKANKTLLKADIKEFYPSISEGLVKEAISYCRSKGIQVSDDEVTCILKAKYQIASSLGTDWVKKDSPFDNSMGGLDSCELCELIGLFLLGKIKDNLGKMDPSISIALYRDDMILVIRKHGKIINETKSILTKMFKEQGLILCDWEEGPTQNYLDIEFDLEQNVYRPYKKLKDNTKYVSSQSDHPGTVLKGIPNIVNNRINMLCSNETIFKTKKWNMKKL